MLTFRKKHTAYSVEVIISHPDSTQKRLAYTMRTLATRQDKVSYEFLLLKRDNLLIDDQPPSQIMDKLMTELGDALYPVTCLTDRSVTISTVNNFNEIKELWEERSKRLLEEYYTRPFGKYVGTSKVNFENADKFLSAFKRDTFVQLFFCGLGNRRIEIDCFNFPEQHKKTTYYGKADRGLHYTLFPAIMENGTSEMGGEIDYDLCYDGRLSYLNAQFFLAKEDGDRYRKTVFIKAEE